LEHQLPRILLRRFGYESPARPLSPAPPWPYETRPCWLASARFAPLAHWTRWVIPANAGTHRSQWPQQPPEPQITERRASKASNAPNRMRQAGKRSEAADQATREPGSAGRPVAPPRGDRRASAV